MLLAHGSPDPRSARAIRILARAAGAPAAFLDFDRPRPIEVLRKLAARGVREVVLAPLLLTRAHHSRVDVPRIAAAAAAELPELRIAIAEPLGDRRLVAALARPLPPCDGIVVAAAGSRDRDACESVRRRAAELSELLGIPALAGFASAAEPAVADAVAALRASGSRRVAVASYFIAPGVLHDRAVRSAMDAGAEFATPPLGAAPELVDLVRSRVGQCAVELSATVAL